MAPEPPKPLEPGFPSGYTAGSRCLRTRRVAFSSSGDVTRHSASAPRPRNAVIAVLGDAAESLFATLFPSDCRFCGAPLLRVSRVPVCDSCLDNIRTLDVPVCSVCGEALLSSAANDCCGECLREQPPFARAIAYGSYEGGLRDLIHLLKYEHVRPAASVLGRMLGEAISALKPQFGLAPVVVPVPLHASKLRQRGFNQSELIARAALKVVPMELPIRPSVLVRRRPTESQTGLTRAQRRLNIRGAFEVSRSNEITGRDILLIDDVYTTGTTVSECARVLRRAGADRVWVATVARVLKAEATYALPHDAPEAASDENSDAALSTRAAHA